MGKIRYTKGELKRQRDSLKQFRHYLPILQLKKQQIQLEVQRVHQRIREQRDTIETLKREIAAWAGLLIERPRQFGQWVKPKRVIMTGVNIASVDLPVFERIEFEDAEYNLFSTALWVDTAVEKIRAFIAAREQMRILLEQEKLLTDELRTTTQRVNLFEKVKIPEAIEAIRKVRIFLGDQQANAVGRSKLAKNKIMQAIAEGALA